jgi:dipeptidyl aminopeptidase/acylaminoacyl peptidase
MSKRLITAEDLLKFSFVGDTQISPCGGLVLFSVRRYTEKNRQVSHLWTCDAQGNSLRQWTQGKESAGQGRFSPNGEFLSFLAKRGAPSPQIQLLPLSGGEARTLTSFPEGDIAWHSWSPDSRWILVSFRETPDERKEAAVKDRESKGLSTPPWELEDIWWRLDGDGVFGAARHHLYLVDAQTGSHRLFFDESKSGSPSCTWLPDSSGVVLAYDPRPQPLLGRPEVHLYNLTLKGRLKKIKTGISGSKSTPRVSPNGEHVAWMGDDDPEGWGVNNTALYVAPMDGGEGRRITFGADQDFDVMTLSDCNAGHTSDGGGSGFLEWSPDGSHLYSNLGRHGEVNLVSIALSDGLVTPITKGSHTCAAAAISPDGTWFAGTWGHATLLNEAARFDLSGQIAPLTSFNHWVNKEISLSQPEEHWIASTDGARVHTWIMMPPSLKDKEKKAKKGAAILEIHGGPHGQYGSAFFHEFQLLAAEGHIVVFSNPRGSKGYGEDWTNAIRSRWGDKDWDDIQAVMTWMQNHPKIDAKRMGVMGGSYGGWMTNWVIGHSHAFKAAITDRCVSNMVSFAGTCDFPANDREYFGGVAYGSLERISALWRQSPIAYFEGVRTPTLIIHSEGDLRCSIEQSEQVFAALQAQGVESRFIRYPANTSHGMSRGGPGDMRLHRLNEITSWWRAKLG